MGWTKQTDGEVEGRTEKKKEEGRRKKEQEVMSLLVPFHAHTCIYAPGSMVNRYTWCGKLKCEGEIRLIDFGKWLWKHGIGFCDGGKANGDYEGHQNGLRNNEIYSFFFIDFSRLDGF